MKLPTVKLNGVDYVVDFTLQEMRRCSDLHDRIPFDQLKDEGEFYTIKFVAGTDNELPGDGILYPYGSLIECNIPAYVVDYPASMIDKFLK